VDSNQLEKAIGHCSQRVLDVELDDMGEILLDNLDISNAEDEAAPAIDDQAVDDAPVVRYINKVLLDAIKKGASDIHFEPYEKYYRIRLRLDGILVESGAPPTKFTNYLTARLKILASLDISERRIPQDGRFKLRMSKTRSIDFRINTCPTLFGEKVVLRLLESSSDLLNVDVLGMNETQKKTFLDNIHRSQGMVLVTGPTGSGKTVTQYTGLHIFNLAEKNISTVEDPVEIQLPGINQVAVNIKRGMMFSTALRAFHRQDPDIIMVGEVRDLETAEICVKAAQTRTLSVINAAH